MTKLRLLNDSELESLKGGSSGCTQAGDTILCEALVGKIVLCGTHEASCAGRFAFNCESTKKYDVICESRFTLTPED